MFHEEGSYPHESLEGAPQPRKLWERAEARESRGTVQGTIASWRATLALGICVLVLGPSP